MRKQFKNTVFDIAKIDRKLVLVIGDISVYLFKDFWELFPIGLAYTFYLNRFAR